ncbi:hypothetical protein TeGR_g6423, partial [Tetraparma gracilis]
GGGEQVQFPRSVYMVFEYLSYDLFGLLHTPEVRLTKRRLKSWAHQLLTGVHYLHARGVLHRSRSWVTAGLTALVTGLLELDPGERLSASAALDAGFFFEAGDRLLDAWELDMGFGVASVHECEVRGRRQEQVKG